MPEFIILTRCPKCSGRMLIQRTEEIDRRIRRQQRDKTDWTKHYLTCPKCGWEIWRKSDFELWKELDNMYRTIRIKGLEKSTRRQVIFEVRANGLGVHVFCQPGDNWNIEEGSLRLSTGLFDDDEKEIFDNDVLAVYDNNEDEIVRCVVAYNHDKAMYCLYPAEKDILEKGIHQLPLGQALSQIHKISEYWGCRIIGTRRDFNEKLEEL